MTISISSTSRFGRLRGVGGAALAIALSLGAVPRPAPAVTPVVDALAIAKMIEQKPESVNCEHKMRVLCLNINDLLV